MNKFNDRLALKVTGAVGSMWCAYIFAGLACVSLPSAVHTGDLIVIVSWVAQTFLQLVLLSIILKGQNISGERQEQMIKHIEHLVELIEKEEEQELSEMEGKH